MVLEDQGCLFVFVGLRDSVFVVHFGWREREREKRWSFLLLCGSASSV